MFGVGTGEILLILVIAMLVVGPERMVEFSRTMGRMIAQFRHTTDEATKEFREAFAVDELQELRKEVQSARDDIATAMSANAPTTPVPQRQVTAEAQAPIPAEAIAEPIETVTLKEVLADELVDGEIEVEAPAQPVVAAEATAAPGDQPVTAGESRPDPAAEATVIELAGLVPEDPDVEPTIIETVEIAAEEPAPSPEAAKN